MAFDSEGPLFSGFFDFFGHPTAGLRINAVAVLMDDRAGRLAAQQCGLAVIGTIGLLEQAAVRGWVDLSEVMAKLQQTNARLDPKLIQAAIEREKARKQARG